MKAKIYTIFIALICVFLVVGCKSNDNEKIVKSNCTIFDCINKIEPENQVKEINEIIGFKGETKDKKYKIYEWKLSDKESIQVAYYSSDKSQIKIKYNKKDLINTKVNFSDYEKIKEDLKKGVKISYKDLTKKFKSKGTLVGKSSISKKYTWVSKNGSYLTATISNANERCTLITGKVK